MNRNLDNLGRLVIPVEMRNKLGIENGNEVKLELVGNKIIITNPKEIDYKAKYEAALREIEELENQLFIQRERGE